ncbi:MAG: hypothetical protein KME40_19225 [Komarekiella atlantica HA4396-MV6]|nr:hypothetical protein [Komarekiella atlantica HA4396-MV6]
MRTGFPNLGTPLATSRETRPTQWPNFSRQINIGVYQCTLREAAARLHRWFDLTNLDLCKRSNT